MAKLNMREVNQNILLGISDNYNPGQLKLVSSSKEIARFTDDLGGFRISLIGSDIKVKNGEVIFGTIDEVQFRTDKGALFATVSDVTQNFLKIDNAIQGNEGVERLLKTLLSEDDLLIGTNSFDNLDGRKGDDVIRANGAADKLTGGGGNDTMFGGGGNDTFYYRDGDVGHDVIKDFNVGNKTNFDSILIEDHGYSFIKASDGDLKIKFANGEGSVILDGVHFSERNDANIDTLL